MMATRRTERRSSVYSMATDDSIGPMTRTRAGSQPKRKFFAEEMSPVPTRLRRSRTAAPSLPSKQSVTPARSSRRSSIVEAVDSDSGLSSSSPSSSTPSTTTAEVKSLGDEALDDPTLLLNAEYLLEGETHDQDVPTVDPCQDEDDESPQVAPKRVIKHGPNQFDDDALPVSVFKAISQEFKFMHPWAAQGLTAKWFIDVPDHTVPQQDPMEAYRQAAAALRVALQRRKAQHSVELKRKAPAGRRPSLGSATAVSGGAFVPVRPVGRPRQVAPAVPAPAPAPATAAATTAPMPATPAQPTLSSLAAEALKTNPFGLAAARPPTVAASPAAGSAPRAGPVSVSPRQPQQPEQPVQQGSKPQAPQVVPRAPPSSVTYVPVRSGTTTTAAAVGGAPAGNSCICPICDQLAAAAAKRQKLGLPQQPAPALAARPTSTTGVPTTAARLAAMMATPVPAAGKAPASVGGVAPQRPASAAAAMGASVGAPGVAFVPNPVMPVVSTPISLPPALFTVPPQPQPQPQQQSQPQPAASQVPYAVQRSVIDTARLPAQSVFASGQAVAIPAARSRAQSEPQPGHERLLDTPTPSAASALGVVSHRPSRSVPSSPVPVLEKQVRAPSPQVVPRPTDEADRDDEGDEDEEVDIESFSPQKESGELQQPFHPGDKPLPLLLSAAVPWQSARGRLPQEARTQLHRWFAEHVADPTASRQDIARLTIATGMTRRQVRGWLSHARRRFVTLTTVAAQNQPAQAQLQQWLERHSEQPFLSAAETAELSALTGLDAVTICAWMEQARSLNFNAGLSAQGSLLGKWWGSQWNAQQQPAVDGNGATHLSG